MYRFTVANLAAAPAAALSIGALMKDVATSTVYRSVVVDGVAEWMESTATLAQDDVGGASGAVISTDIQAVALTGNVVLDATYKRKLLVTPNADGHIIELPASYPLAEMEIINASATYNVLIHQQDTGGYLETIEAGPYLSYSFLRDPVSGDWF